MPRSPVEAGELSPSPKKQEERMDDEILDIKPPQAKKDKKKHKHKRKEHKKDREAAHERRRRDSVEEVERTARRGEDRHDQDSRARRDDRYDDRYSSSRREYDDRTIPRTDSRSNLSDYSRPSQQRYSPSSRDRRDIRDIVDIAPRRDVQRDSRRDAPRQPVRYDDDRRDRRGGRSAPFADYRREDSPTRRETDRRGDRSRSPRPPARDDRSRDERPRDAREMIDKKRVGEKRADRAEAESRDSSRNRSNRGRVMTTNDDKENKKDSVAGSGKQVMQISSSSEGDSAEEESDNSEEEESEEDGSGESGSSEEESSEEDEEMTGSEQSGSESDDSDSQTEHQSKRRRSRDKKRNKSKFESSESESSEDEKLSPNDDESQHEENTTPRDDELPDSPVLSEPPSPPAKLPPYLPAIQGCRSVDEFRHLNRIEEGTYGVVFRAEDLKLKEIVALKKLKMEKEKEGFPITSLREINTLLKTQHENIVTVREIVVGSNMDKIYLVMDFVEHDLKNLMEVMKNPFSIGEVKTLLCQLLKAVAHMHDNWILHRDLKTSNLLLSHKGILKVGDFGLAREYGSPLKNYTPVVVTLWYRAPELLLGCKKYSCPIDMWSVGCIFAEIILSKPLWQGKSEQDQLNKIFRDLGTPNEDIWPGVKQLPAMQKVTFANYPYNSLRKRFDDMPSRFDDHANSLLNKFLTYDPSKRITAAEALHHKYFDVHPRPIDPSMFPTWPARSEQPRGTKRQKTPAPPSGGAAYKKITEDDMGGLFAAGGAGNSGFQLKF